MGKVDLRALLSRVRSWFKDLSRPKKIATMTVAAATGISTILGVVNGSITLYEKVTGSSSEPSTPLVEPSSEPSTPLVSNPRAGNPLVEPPNAPSNLELVDVSFITPGFQESPALDIKLRNNGGSTAFIKRADLKVKTVWTLIPPYTCYQPGLCDRVGAPMPPSFEYEVEFPNKVPPYTVSQNLSQSLEPSDLDRFTIKLIPSWAQSNNYDRDERREAREKDYVFFVTLSLVYDEDDKQLSRDVLFAFYPADNESYKEEERRDGSPHYVLREGLDESSAATVTSQNKQAIEEIEQVAEQAAAPKNKYLELLIERVSQS